MSRPCEGNGECLEQQNDGTYSENSRFNDTTCTHNCKPISCPNALVCGNDRLPSWVVTIKGSGACIHCHYRFHKKLDFVETTECPICFETTTCVVQPNCSHPTCISCFKRSQYGDQTPCPPFPYSESVQDEWNEVDDNDPVFHTKYPLARKWLEDCDKHEYIESVKWNNEKSLRVCPICRR